MPAWTVRISLCLLVAAGATRCGPRWEAAFDPGANWLMNAWGSSATDVYAVGGTLDQGRVMHFDGGGWTEVDVGVQVPLLNWAWGSGPEDVFVVGNDGTVLHFDGAGWTRQPTGVIDTLWGVWGSARDDVWAVGGSGFAPGPPVILHYDGTGWTKQPPPALSREVFAWFKVWGTGPDNVIVVGQDGALVRWDGAAWREEDSGTREDLISVWGTAPEQIVAVGGRGNGVVTRWDGATWSSSSLSPLPGINGVWMRSAGSAWIAGGLGTLARLDLETMEATQEPIEETTLEFHNVFGVDGRLWAVGGNLQVGASTKRYQGIALTRPE